MTLPQLLTIGGRDVPLVCLRPPGARRLSLRADALKGEIRLTLPRRAPLADGAEFVRRHGAWLAARVASWPHPLPFVPGAQIPIEGERITIDWDPRHPRRPILERDRLVLGGEAEAVPRRARHYLQTLARQRLEEESRAAAETIGRAPTQVTVRDQRSRWGSCSASGSIAYSWRLILAPAFVRRHVVAHEVAHLAHLNHGPDFQALVRRLAESDPTDARRWLAANGASLHWVGRAA